MKALLYLFTLISFTLNAQNKFLTKTGTISFEASVPSFEEVSATNNSITVIIDADSGKFAALALVKGFRFKNALMEEHFNENYVESDLYPKAKFKGAIEGFNFYDLSRNETEHKISGILEFHGNTKEIVDCIIHLKLLDDNSILMEGTFEVNASDFNIEIPKIVKSKVSETVAIRFEFNLTKN